MNGVEWQGLHGYLSACNIMLLGFLAGLVLPSFMTCMLNC